LNAGEAELYPDRWYPAKAFALSQFYVGASRGIARLLPSRIDPAFKFGRLFPLLTWIIVIGFGVSLQVFDSSSFHRLRPRPNL